MSQVSLQRLVSEGEDQRCIARVQPRHGQLVEVVRVARAFLTLAHLDKEKSHSMSVDRRVPIGFLGVQGSVRIGCLDTGRVEGFLLVVWGCRGMYSLVARILAMQKDSYWLSRVQGSVLIGCPDICNAK